MVASHVQIQMLSVSQSYLHFSVSLPEMLGRLNTAMQISHTGTHPSSRVARRLLPLGSGSVKFKPTNKNVHLITKVNSRRRLGASVV